MLKEMVLSEAVRRRCYRKHAIPLAATLCASLLATPASRAQAQVSDAEPDAARGANAPVQEVVVTGSRFGSRTITESATPIDVIPASELARSGALQLQNALKTLVPSFSVSAPATAGALDFTSSPTLRGLGPGELLLMVNGKRRHSTGMLNTANQIGRGDVGYDFSAIPTAAIGRIEVLRDGASAQYGADAIAGVINLVLDKTVGASASLQGGVTGEGDGAQYEFNGSVGVPLGDDGVLRTSVRLQHRERSNRALPDTRQQYFGAGGSKAISANYGSGTGVTPANGTLDPREATIDRNTYWLGDAPFDAGAVFFNGSKPLAAGASLYAFGGYSKVDGDSAGFVRRAGQDETVRSLHPDGYRPGINVVLENPSIAFGAKGQDWLGLDWDISTEYGQSRVDTRRSNSNNVSLGAASPTVDYQGGVRFGQWTTNLDLSRELELAQGAPLKLAAGLEFRKEYYEAVAGSPSSYQNGGVTILDGPNKGKPAPIGFQPSPGVQPQDATSQQRHSVALYGELERQLTIDWLLSGAARYEDFSDFGSSSTYKLSTRYQLAPGLALRGSYSTGFRAPNLAQSFASNTSTVFVSGNPVQQRLLPVDHPLARALGATDLRPEESRSISVGAVYDRDGLTVSGDAYRISIDDRLALSSMFQDARLTTLAANLGYTGIGAVSYMTNAIDTVTKGIDLTASYRFHLARAGALTVTAAGNYNKTEIKRIAGTPEPLRAIGLATPLFDTTQQVRLSDASPKDKYLLGVKWQRGPFTVNLNNTRYGEVASVAFTSLTPAQLAVVTKGYHVELKPTDTPSANSQVVQIFGAKIISDLTASYQHGRTSYTFGVNNLFDTYPDKNIASTAASVAAGTNGSDNAGTFPYNYVSPFGYTGRAFFVKLDHKF